MPTLDALIRSAPAHLRLAAPPGPRARDRHVAGVWPAPPPGAPDPASPAHTPDRERGWRDVLAVLPAPPPAPAQCDALARSLAEAGAAALAVAQAPAADGTGPLLEAAARHHLPVLLAAPGRCTVPYLAQVLADAAADAAAGLQGLLECCRGLADGNAAGVLRWLAAAVDGQAVLLAPHRPPPPPPPRPTPPPDPLAPPPDGTTHAATADAGEWNVRLYALGPAPAPYHVLAVARARTRGWPQQATDAVAQAEQLLSSWLRMRRAAERERASIRTSVLQMLMSGHVVAARRAAAPLDISPRLLAAEEVRVHVVGGRSAHRDTLVSSCHHHLGDAALVVGCPVDDHQIVIVATPETALTDRIRRLVTERPGFHLGASRPVPLDALATGHGEATRALAAARSSPERYAVFTPDADLVRLLPEAPARRWAAALLAPLDGWPPARRAEQLDGARLWLSYGPTGAARLAGCHRNTVRQRVEALGQELHLDLAHIGGRIRLDLALRVTALHRAAAPLPPDHTAPPTLEELLTGEAVRAWAADYLALLDAGLLRTATTWLTSGRHTPTAARRLGVHPKTVAARLRRAEARLRRPLISHPSPEDAPEAANGLCGAHDLILAAGLTGLIPCP